jgi:comEA protein
LKIYLSLLLFVISFSCEAQEIYWEHIKSIDKRRLEFNQVLPAPMKININTADKKKLMQLEGVGIKKAQAIIQYREQNGPFKTVQELGKVKGITKKILQKLQDKNKDTIVLSEDY